MFLNALVEIDHRPTQNTTVRFDAPVELGKRTAGEFGAHSEEGDHPHPKDGARSTHSNRDGDSPNIAESDRRRERRRERLEVRDFSFIFRSIVLAANHVDRMPKQP